MHSSRQLRMAGLWVESPNHPPLQGHWNLGFTRLAPPTTLAGACAGRHCSCADGDTDPELPPLRAARAMLSLSEPQRTQRKVQSLPPDPGRHRRGEIGVGDAHRVLLRTDPPGWALAGVNDG